MLSLEFPNISHKDAFLDMLQEWDGTDENSTVPHMLFGHVSYEDFLQAVEADVLGVPGKVPAHLFFLVENDRILGAIQVRHHINHPNLLEAG